ncbi:MAG: hypothetical protein GDA40_05800 [Rhodobacteraceae bacterium]|nr:hypothetical protein [Paracoccaceae bacterium]
MAYSSAHHRHGVIWQILVAVMAAICILAAVPATAQDANADPSAETASADAA